MTDHTADCCAPHPANAARVAIDGVTPAERTAHPHRRGDATTAELLVVGSLITMDDAMPHAEALGCASELGRCRSIVGAGTTADAQLAVYEKHERKEGCELALTAVTDWLATATLQ